jgi:hypothetical protein
MESAPFKLTSEMVAVMGGVNSEGFEYSTVQCSSVKYSVLCSTVPASPVVAFLLAITVRECEFC